MKKKLFALFMFTLFACGLFTACNSKSNISGEFNKENYIVSIDDTINFLDELNVKGIEKNKISLISSNENILESVGNGIFKAKTSGQTYILAKNQNKVIAQTKVNVKYRFSSPSNLTINKDGMISWDKSFVLVDNRVIYADKYVVKFAKFNEEGKLSSFKEEVVETNQFSLQEKGEYKVIVEACKNEEYGIEESKVEKRLNNGVVGLVEDAALTVIGEIDNQIANFSWEAKENVIYDIYLEGFLIIENISESSFQFDYSRFASGSEIELIIDAKDSIGTKLSSKSKFILNKLETPNVEYKFENKDGFIKWAGNENASKFLLKVIDISGTIQVHEFESEEEIKTFLNDYEGGSYNIQVMAVGNSEREFFLNSNTSEVMTISKISKPETEVEIAGNKANITFDDSAYSKNYRISIGGQSFVYNTALGYKTVVDLSAFNVGEYNFEVIALPNSDASSDTGVEPLTQSEVSSNKVINSNAFTYDLYILEEIGDINHSMSDNVSTLTFDEIENANDYALYINDQLISDVERNIIDGKVNISFEDLYKIEPKDNNYNLKIVASRIVDGKDYAVKQEKIKTLSILSIVEEADNQTNGFFAWKEVEGSEYYYEVYKTDENYQILDPLNPEISATTSETTTSPKLDEGYYYTIKVYTKSTDENVYLNADFYDESKVFTKNFIVTKQIESPEITFSDENDVYSLTIKGVELGGKYQIYVDGALDGEFNVSEEKEEYEYVLDNKFTTAKEYQVSVVASSGLLFDENTFVPSEESIVNITRLAQTQFTMDYVKDVFGRKTNENMVFAELSNSVAVEIVMDGNVILNNGYILDIIDYTKFDSEFKLFARYIAAENQENNYYLDSNIKEFTFKRAVAPSDIVYDDGFIKWTGPSADTFDNYQGVITLVNSSLSNFYYAFEISNTLSQYNVQSVIDGLIKINSTFASAYRQAEKIQIEMFTFADGLSGEIYSLPSVKGTTSKGLTILDVLTLEKPVVSFDTKTQIISWTEEVENSTYNIYVDGVLAVENHETNSILLSNIGSYDYLTAKSITVQAKNKAYLASENSQAITIEEIEIEQRLSIAKNSDNYSATYNILADQSKISEVWVNGVKTNVNYTEGGQTATFNLSDFASTSFELVLKAKNQSESNYYLDSKAVTFTLENLADKTFEITHDQKNNLLEIQDSLSWNDFRDDLVGNSLQPIVYKVYVVNGLNQYDFVVNENTLNLEEIQSFIRASLEGDVEITVKAIVEKDYVVSGENNFGCYGSIESNKFTTTRIEDAVISEINVCEEARVSSPLKQKMFAGIEVVFENKWKSFDNLVFNFNWTTTDGDEVYSFNQSALKEVDGNYYAYIQVRDYNSETLQNKFFDKTPQNVLLTVGRNEYINSDATTFTVNRFNKISSLSLDDDGVLTINDTQNASYYLELKIADKTIYKTVSASDLSSPKTIDLMTSDFFGSTTDSGNYEVRVIAVDENQKILPSAEAMIVSGYKLEGISNIAIDENGNIVFTLEYADYEDLIFTASTLGVQKDFETEKVEGSSTQFFISMNNLFNLFENDITLETKEYEFNFTVRKNGSINANWQEFSLNYVSNDSALQVRGGNLEKDYILFDKIDSTQLFNIKINGLYLETTVDEDGNEISSIVRKDKQLYLLAADLLKFWEKGVDDKYYANDTGLPENEFYIIDLRQILADIEYGEVEINISRIGKDSNDIYYQYNDFDFSVYKLNKIIDDPASPNKIKIKDNIISWTWENKEVESSNAPSAYYIIIEKIIKTLVGQEKVEMVYSTTSKILTTASSYDLRMANLESKENDDESIVAINYNLSVVAINYNSNIIASSQSLSVDTYRYTKPISLEVEDGKIVFNIQEFKESDFMVDVQNYFASPTGQNYYTTVGAKIYSSPFYFASQNIESVVFQIKFRKIESGGVTNTEYIYRIKAIDLFPDFEIDADSSFGVGTTESYINLLKNYLSNMEDSSEINQLNTKYMIGSILNSKLGIGDNGLLIDDIAQNLPGGNYEVSVCQLGNANNIESGYSEIEEIYISNAPQYSLDMDGEDYVAIVTPVMNAINNGNSYEEYYSTIYKMQFRGSASNADFIISYNSTLEEWSVSCNEKTLDNVVSSVSWSGSIPKFKINMNRLRDALEDEGLSHLISQNDEIIVSLFTYAQDDEKVVNGKSSRFAVQFQDLGINDFSLKNGKLSVSTNLTNYQMLMKIKNSTSVEETVTLQAQGNNVDVVLEESGEYEYIILSIKGSMTSSKLVVSSKPYIIKNLYKLNTPSLYTRNNNIIVEYTQKDINNVGADLLSTIKFNMANDISLNENYKGESGYYYSSSLVSTNNFIPYVVGSKDVNGDTKYPSELMAEEFFVYLNGNSATFTQDGKDANGRVIMTFDQPKIILASETSSIEAIMLPYLAGIGLSEGDIVLDDRMIGINAITNAEGQDLSANIVYEIVVHYHNELGEEITTETYYSERKFASDYSSVQQIVNSSFVSSAFDFDFISLNVTTLGAIKTTKNDPYAIKTLEGTYISLQDSVYYGYNPVYPNAPYGGQVLRSQALVTPLFTRTPTPYIENANTVVKDGNINFVIDESLFYTNDSNSKEVNTANRISITAQYTVNGEVLTEVLTGNFNFSTSTASEDTKKVFVSFTPDINSKLLENAGNRAVSIFITIYSESSITSLPLKIDNIYKLISVNEDYYSIDVKVENGVGTYINLSNYFNKVSINNDKSCYKLILTFYDKDSKVITYNDKNGNPVDNIAEIMYNKTKHLNIVNDIAEIIESDTKQIKIDENASYFTIQVIDGQENTIVNPKKLLYSDLITFEINKTDISDLNLSWNSENMSFEWIWGQENSNKYEYFIDLTIDDKTENEIINTDYYMPQNRGVIQNNGFKLMARQLAEIDNVIYIFSEQLIYQGENIQFNLFSGGNGREENPYLIANEIDFVNISRRNTQDRVYYFELTNNLTIDVDAMIENGEHIMPNFYGNLSGKGYTIKITSSKVYALNDEFNSTMAGGASIKFSQYSSLFYNIAKVARIENLVIEYKINYNGLDSSNILFSPLAAYNYGVVNNVRLSTFEIENLNGSGNNNVLVGGIVSVNYGTIQNCNNISSFKYSMVQQLSLNFGYGGICCFNSMKNNNTIGKIIHCFNLGEKEVVVYKNNNIIYMAGISIDNSGKISASGNDGNLKLSSASTSVKQFSGYYAGITLSNSGTIEYVYNNGLIEQTAGTLNFSGIVYQVSGGNLNSLIVTVVDQPVVKNCLKPPTVKSGTIYAVTSSATSTSISTNTLSGYLSIDCLNGYYLVVTEADGAFKAAIEKA